VSGHLEKGLRDSTRVHAVGNDNYRCDLASRSPQDRSSLRSTLARVIIVLVISCTLVLVTTPASASGLMAPLGSMNYPSNPNPTFDPATLPMCPPPSDTPAAPTPLPFADPAAPHCYVSPQVGGLVVNGIPSESNAPLVLNPNNPPGPAIGPVSVSPSSPSCGPNCVAHYNGVQQYECYGCGGVVSWEESRRIIYYGNASNWNWVGVQTPGAGDTFWQIGYLVSSVNNLCDNVATPTDTEILFSEVELNGTLWPPFCWTHYSFPSGAITGMMELYVGNDTWQQWIDYNNNWEVVNALGPVPSLTPSNNNGLVMSLIPSELQYYGDQYAAPYFSTPYRDEFNQIQVLGSWYLWDVPVLNATYRQGPFCWEPGTSSHNYTTITVYPSGLPGGECRTLRTGTYPPTLLDRSGNG
jgi:hypothetical protein